MMLSKKYEILIIFLISFIFIMFGIILKTSTFSPDSWGYYELSKTIFSDNFYGFNTYRSYISDYKSAAFPFGFPIILSIVNNLIGFNPINAVYLNIIVSILNIYLILRITLLINISYLFSWLLAISFLSYSSYLDEIYAGRSMPLAIFLYLCGIYYLINKKIFMAGLLLGFSCLVRFDYLIFSLLTVFYYILVDPKRRYVILLSLILGILPWILYSYLFFDTIWISDNSWVAKSSYSSFAGDFPAVASHTIFTHPFDWILKIINNFKSVLLYLIYYSKEYFIVIIGSIIFIYKYRKLLNLRDYLFFFFLLVSLLPYAATGYFDGRYYSLFFLILSVFIFYRINSMLRVNIKFIFILIVVNLLICSYWFSFITKRSYAKVEYNYKQEKTIYKLRDYQINSNMRYIFESPLLAVKYGALTGGRSAVLPTNFKILDEQTKKEYFLKMSPFIFVTEDYFIKVYMDTKND